MSLTKNELEQAAKYLDDRANEILEQGKTVIVAGGNPTGIADKLDRVKWLLDLSERVAALAVRTAP